ncbi:limbin [Echinops telfairi]|uniref:Limbin n=1 Tax=Echinops telfairi TaxID=9371 RepID=A0AC55D0Z5_ECHTE|nr:limbin [Echinops telfairi]
MRPDAALGLSRPLARPTLAAEGEGPYALGRVRKERAGSVAQGRRRSPFGAANYGEKGGPLGLAAALALASSPLLGTPPLQPAPVLSPPSEPSGNSGHFNPLLTSAASGGLWTHSLLAFMPSWTKKTLFKRESPTTPRLVSTQSAAWTAQVWLLVNNSRSPRTTDLSDLLLLDNVSGLSVRESVGNRTSRGFQAFRKQSLPAGDAFAVSYMAQLAAGEVQDEAILLLPAQLTFQSSAQNRTQLKAVLTITVEEKLTILPNHGLHAAAFFIAFLASLVLTWTTLFLLVRYQCLKGNPLSRHQVQHHESKPEHAQFTLADGVNEDLALGDQMVDILASEDPGSMLQALEDLEIATLNQADSDLEACRTQISKDVIALLLKQQASGGRLSPQVERRMGSVFKKQFLLLENEVQEEHGRKMVAVTAECDLETRKKTESQSQREMLCAAECSSLLRTLHGLEQGHLRRALALRQEEDLAQAHRQLALFQRSELHRIFFTQIKSALLSGELTPEAARTLLQDYSESQAHVEELMDFFQATKRYHLSKRFGHREYLIQTMQSSETRAQGLLNAAAAQLTRLIQKHERARLLRGVFQALSSQEQMHKEQRREQLSIGEAPQHAKDTSQYLGQWRSLMADQSAALEELQEWLDQAALDDLQALTLSLSEKATEEVQRLQSSAMTQELLRRSVPWLFLQQILEEHSKEMASRAEQLEGEERGRGQEGAQSPRQRLKEDAPEASMEEQAELRHWEHAVFTKLCAAACSLSEEELLRVKQEAQGCLAQLDQSLALPKVRARVLLQQCQAEWREAEFLKLDQALAAPELQLQSKGRKQRAKNRSKAGLLKKYLEDKILLLEEQPPEDLAEKARSELLRERLELLEAQEQRVAEFVVSLQFQKAAETSKRLSAYTALLCLQDVLLEELCEAETLTKEARTQILQSHTPELQELERRLEEQLACQEAASQQQALLSRQPCGAQDPGLPDTPAEADSEGQVSAMLQRALSKAQKTLEHQQQSLQEAHQQSAVLEDLLETMETDTFVTLYGQGTPGPVASLREQAAKREHQARWRAFESKLRRGLVSQGEERALWARRRKESVLRKASAPLPERLVFPGKGSWPHLSLEPLGELAPVSIVGTDAEDLLNTGEKLFIFRNPTEPELALHVPPRRKKKNFLNAKKGTWAAGVD